MSFDFGHGPGYDLFADSMATEAFDKRIQIMGAFQASQILTQSLPYIGSNQRLITRKAQFWRNPFQVFHDILGHADVYWNHRTIFL